MPLNGSNPLLIDLASLRHLAQLIGELRERGHDGDCMRALVDHVHDAGTLAAADVRRGLDELERGDLERASWRMRSCASPQPVVSSRRSPNGSGARTRLPLMHCAARVRRRR